MKQWLMENKSGMYSKVREEEDGMEVSYEELKRHVEGLLTAAKVDLDEPAYYLGGSGMGFGEDFEEVSSAREIAEIVADEIYDYVTTVEGGESDLSSMKLSDPKECVGEYNEEFKPIIEKENLVPKVQLEDSEVDYAWEVWQADAFLNKIKGTNFSLNEMNPAALGAPQAAADAAMQQQDDQIGTYVDDAEMGEAYGMEDKPDPEKYQIVRDEKTGDIIKATNDEGSVFKVGDTVKMGKISPRIGAFKEEQGKVKAIVTTGLFSQAIDIDGLETEVKEDVGVGYVMKVAPADPDSRRF